MAAAQYSEIGDNSPLLPKRMGDPEEGIMLKEKHE
jgi:hypothetical protein